MANQVFEHNARIGHTQTERRNAQITNRIGKLNRVSLNMNNGKQVVPYELPEEDFYRVCDRLSKELEVFV
jgi:hypothetical protein